MYPKKADEEKAELRREVRAVELEGSGSKTGQETNKEVTATNVVHNDHRGNCDTKRQHTMKKERGPMETRNQELRGTTTQMVERAAE